MFLFLMGESSKQMGQWLSYEFTTRGYAQVVHIDRDDQNSTRHVLSVLGVHPDNHSDGENYLTIFTSRDLWFLGDRSIHGVEIYFETLGGVLMTEEDHLYENINTREKLPSYQRASYTSVPVSSTDNYLKFIQSHLEYGKMRGKQIFSASKGGYFGEVLGAPRTIFVSDCAHDDSSFFSDVSTALNIRQHLVSSHGNHIGVSALDVVTDIQEMYPFSGYVAIGSNAYNFISKYMDDDIIKAGIPHPKGIKDWSDRDKVYSRFAKLTANVVESGTRKTSLLSL